MLRELATKRGNQLPDTATLYVTLLSFSLICVHSCYGYVSTYPGTQLPSSLQFLPLPLPVISPELFPFAPFSATRLLSPRRQPRSSSHPLWLRRQREDYHHRYHRLHFQSLIFLNKVCVFCLFVLTSSGCAWTRLTSISLHFALKWTGNVLGAQAGRGAGGALA